jgi:hypothetical protein
MMSKAAKDRKFRLTAAFAVAAAIALSLTGIGFGQEAAGPDERRPAGGAGSATAALLRNEPAAFQGYTLIAPMNSTSTYLIDMQGRVVRSWQSDLTPGHTAFLLENGNLLRAGALRGVPWGNGPGAGGKLQEYTWDGELVWDFTYSTDTQLPHHDFVRLPNGNIVMVVRERKTAAEAVAVGRAPAGLRAGELQPDCLIEVKPTGKTTGEVVWEWHLWDHLVQDFDPEKPSYGNPADRPELVDINFGTGILAAALSDPAQREQLRSIGYLGGGGGRGGRGGRGGAGGSDWTHVNALAYNAELDQLVLSVHEFSEIWIIDHSTTTKEAAGHSGGRSGHGGDLLYRWGNPQAYRRGTAADQQLFAQHCSHWIPPGRPGAGNLLVFNNGNGRRDGQYSTVDEIVPPLDADGKYRIEPGQAFGPDAAVWSYSAPNKSDLYSNFISGAERLPNGNTLICSGASGMLMEVTPEKKLVWQYSNPAGGGRGGRGGRGGPDGFGGGPFGPGGPGGPGAPFGPPPIGQILPTFAQNALALSGEQREKLQAVQVDIDAKLKQLLDDEQDRQLEELRSGGGFGGLPQPGTIFSSFQQARLNLTDEQKPQMEALQKHADEELAKILNDDQKAQLAQIAVGVPGRGGPDAGRGDRGRRGQGGLAGGPDGRGRRGDRGGRGGGGQRGNSIFRVYRYGADYPGLAGKELTPGKLLEEVVREPARPNE